MPDRKLQWSGSVASLWGGREQCADVLVSLLQWTSGLALGRWGLIRSSRSSRWSTGGTTRWSVLPCTAVLPPYVPAQRLEGKGSGAVENVEKEIRGLRVGMTWR